MASAAEQLVAHNRFGFGLAPDEEPARDPRGWLAGQIEAFDPMPPLLRSSLALAPLDEFLRLSAGDPNQRRVFYDAHRALVAARAEIARMSATPFAERLVHFWANHFAISADKKAVTAVAASLEFDAIRRHLTGNFLDLLLAAETHPAMLMYLDQSRSLGPNSASGQRRSARGAKNSGLNENLAREILELHTMGARSGYNQTDIVELAKALTGYTVAGMQGGPAAEGRKSGSFIFDPARHEPGERSFLGRRYPQQGAEQVRAMLADIGRQPATARFLAGKLARHFIADRPPGVSVDRLAQSFVRSGGELMPVYHTLIQDEAAWRTGPAKFKTPWDWTVSALRTTGISVDRANWLAQRLGRLGQATWEPGSPAGFSDVQEGWLAPDALARRADVAVELAGFGNRAFDARAVGHHAYLGTLSDHSAGAIAAAGDPEQGLALYLMSPEFLWR